VTVTLARRPGRLDFEIKDNGLGMEAGEPTEGIGLVSMRDRIGAVGGGLEIISSPGKDTSVRGWIPVASEPTAQNSRDTR
jgi:signal transduction histidine kinase